MRGRLDWCDSACQKNSRAGNGARAGHAATRPQTINSIPSILACMPDSACHSKCRQGSGRPPASPLLVLGVALPQTAEPRLREWCATWERTLTPRLSCAQLEHIRRFRLTGAPLRARASRLLARLLALDALPPGTVLDMDALGRPVSAGAPDWLVAFSHSGLAAFCLVVPARPHAGEAPHTAPRGRVPPLVPALDAEAVGPGQMSRAEARDWTLFEALLKAAGSGAGTRRTPGPDPFRAGEQWGHRFLCLPGHQLCVALPGMRPPRMRLSWRQWRSLS